MTKLPRKNTVRRQVYDLIISMTPRSQISINISEIKKPFGPQPRKVEIQSAISQVSKSLGWDVFTRSDNRNPNVLDVVRVE